MNIWHLPKMSATWHALIMLITTLCLIAVFLGLLDMLDLEERLLALLLRIETAGVNGRIVFMLIVCLLTITLLPSVLFTLGAGALYGTTLGSLIIVMAELAGSVLAFLAARHLFGQHMCRSLLRRPRLARLVAIPRRDDWRLLALLRMFPFFPFKLSNYLLGFTPLSLRSYVLGTFIGLWPVTLFNVYLGSVIGDLLMLQSGRATAADFNVWQYAIGLAFVTLVVLLAVRLASRRLRALSVVSH